MCVDFRALNAVTRKNGYPLPRIQECLDMIGKAKFMSKLDLTQGYYQIRVCPPRARTRSAASRGSGTMDSHLLAVSGVKLLAANQEESTMGW